MFRGNCYKKSYFTSSVGGGSVECGFSGAMLVEIEDREEDELIRDMAAGEWRFNSVSTFSTKPCNVLIHVRQ